MREGRGVKKADKEERDGKGGREGGKRRRKEEEGGEEGEGEDICKSGHY